MKVHLKDEIQQQEGLQGDNARSGYVAVLVFPVIIIIGGVVGFSFAGPIRSGGFLIDLILAVIMFAMVLNIRVGDVTVDLIEPFEILVVGWGHSVIHVLD